MILNIDANIENADWPKRTWNLPAYKSEEFYIELVLEHMTLAQFRKLPVYKFAVRNGLIKNDEWTGKEKGVSALDYRNKKRSKK